MKGKISSGLLYTVLTIYSMLVALPLFWMMISSTKTVREIFATPFSFPPQPKWSNFSMVWNKGIADYMLNSLLVVSISVTIIVVVSGLAAYAMARMRFPGRLPIYLMIMAGYAIPIHTVLVPIYIMENTFHMLNQYIGLIGPYVAFAIPFSVLLLYSFFMEFPQDLEDAAHLDGCNTFQMVARVVLPLSMPGLSSVAIFQGVFLWNEFLLALIVITDDAKKTLPLGLTVFQGEWSTNWPSLLAAITLATLPLLLLYILLQKQFINSLTGFSK